MPTERWNDQLFQWPELLIQCQRWAFQAALSGWLISRSGSVYSSGLFRASLMGYPRCDVRQSLGDPSIASGREGFEHLHLHKQQ